MSDETDIGFEKALLRADIAAGNTEAAQLQYGRVVRIEEDEAPSQTESALPHPAGDTPAGEQ